VVLAGENLTVIARRYGVSVQALAAANGITDLDTIYVGQRLVIPASQSSAGDLAHRVTAR
jgi:LysM repeat protein